MTRGDGVCGEQVQTEELAKSVIKPDELAFRVAQVTKGFVGAEIDRGGVAAVLRLNGEEHIGAEQGAEREGERLT